jgi:outer membrane protein assembly factor BamD
MYIGRYYFKKEKWIPAINRFRTVVDDYDKTIYVEEALHRLVEVYYTIGLVSEAEKYANLLGYNYQSSKWYEKSYKVFNKLYKTKEIKKNKKKSIIKKFKSLID